MKTPQQVARDIACWLAARVTDGGFPGRTFYGEAFALWLWSFFPGEFAAETDALLPLALAQLRRADDQAHPEFNLLALLNFCRAKGLAPEECMGPFPALRDTANANWILLGTLDRLLWNRLAERSEHPEARLRANTRLVLLLQQQSDGLIRDDHLLSRQLPIPLPYAKQGHYGLCRVPRLRSLSFQYHCFSLALLWDIYQLTGWREVPHAIERGLHAQTRFAFPNGDTLHIGRGQQQIKGYAALLFTLAGGARQMGLTELLPEWPRVWRHVASHQRADGSLPLVLRRGEEGFPHTVNTADPRWAGWYSYNNYFDYLPLAGVYFARASNLLPSVAAPVGRNGASRSGASLQTTRRYAVIREETWQATIAAPGGATADDQPVPYLCIKGRSVLPCFGGEEVQPGTYDLSMLSLPYAARDDGTLVFLRNAMRWAIRRGKRPRALMLTGRCGWARFVRTYTWGECEFIMEDALELLNQPLWLSMAFPVVFAAFHLEDRGDGSYGLSESSPDLRLTLRGVEGQLETIPGVSALGKTRVLRERLPYTQHSASTMHRSICLSWSCA